MGMEPPTGDMMEGPAFEVLADDEHPGRCTHPCNGISVGNAEKGQSTFEVTQQGDLVQLQSQEGEPDAPGLVLLSPVEMTKVKTQRGKRMHPRSHS